MATDVTIDPNDVFASADSFVKKGISGESISQGDVVYADSVYPYRIKLADANGSIPARTVFGIAITSVYTGQEIEFASSDPRFDCGGNISNGDALYLSKTPGKMVRDTSDFIIGDSIVVIGASFLGSIIDLSIINSGIKIFVPTFDSDFLFTFDSTGPVDFSMATA